MAAIEASNPPDTQPLPARLAPVKWYRSIPPAVVLVLLVTALISALVFAGSELAFSQLVETRKQLWDLVDGRASLLQMQRDIAVAESAQRGFMLTGDKRYLRPFEQASEMAMFELGILLTKSSGIDSLRSRALALGTVLQKKLDELKITVHLSTDDERQKAVALLASNKGVELMEQIARDSRVLDGEVLNESRGLDSMVRTLLWRQRVGAAILVGVNLMFLAALGGRTVKHFHHREVQRQQLASQTAELEAAVQERTEELRTLTTYIQKQSEREKSQLARDLHDEFGALLTAAKLDVAWLQGRNPGDDFQRTERLARLSNELDEAVDLKRRVIESLRPSLLDHLGLGPALEWYVRETCRKAGLNCALHVPEVHVAPEQGLTLYRIAQEALNNAIKHASAKGVRMEIRETPDTLEMLVEDDGVGISHFHPDHLSHGLAGMRHRAQSIGGNLSITTGVGAGTRVKVVLPKQISGASTGA